MEIQVAVNDALVKELEHHANEAFVLKQRVNDLVQELHRANFHRGEALRRMEEAQRELRLIKERWDFELQKREKKIESLKRKCREFKKLWDNRDLAILQRKRQGATHREIGAEFLISDSRVAQIVRQQERKERARLLRDQQLMSNTV